MLVFSLGVPRWRANGGLARRHELRDLDRRTLVFRIHPVELEVVLRRIVGHAGGAAPAALTHACTRAADGQVLLGLTDPIPGRGLGSFADHAPRGESNAALCCDASGVVCLVATRRIERHERITIDYGDRYASAVWIVVFRP